MARFDRLAGTRPGYSYQITADGKYRLHGPSGRIVDWPLLDTKAEALRDIREFDRDLKQLRSDEASEAIAMQGR